MDKNLDTLMKYVALHFEFNAKKYPELIGASEEDTLRFAIRHSALHFSKTAGKVAASSESVDHGGILETEELKSNVAKSLINTLRLAELLKMSATELTELVKESLDKPINH